MTQENQNNNPLTKKYVILHVSGPHARESENKIFKRKKADIENLGYTFWLTQRLDIDMVRDLCKKAEEEGQKAVCLFITPARPGGTVDTKYAIPARAYSEDGVAWRRVPENLSPVTGNIAKKPAVAFKFQTLKMLEPKIEIDLAYYTTFVKGQAIQFKLGDHIKCAVRNETPKNLDQQMKSRIREIVAVGTLVEPYIVHITGANVLIID